MTSSLKLMNLTRFALTAVVGLLLFGASAPRASATLTLAWSDYFTGSGGPGSQWSYQLGTNSSTGEIETLVNSLANCQQTGGHLQIEAQTDSSGRWYSARISAHNWGPYGYIAYCVQFPNAGQGYWPAGWMLGTNIGSVGWPACGEIDVAEEIDGQADNHQSLHMPNYNPTVITNLNSTGAYQTYGAYWQPGYINFTCNSVSEATYTSAEAAAAGGSWPFTAQQFIILDLAIGGPNSWPGATNSGTKDDGNFNISWIQQYNGS
jgi:beta-glucanase (GH16 family)